MSIRTAYPVADVAEASLPGSAREHAGQQGAPVPLMGPADRSDMVPLMGPADSGMATPVMRPAR